LGFGFSWTSSNLSYASAGTFVIAFNTGNITLDPESYALLVTVLVAGSASFAQTQRPVEDSEFRPFGSCCYAEHDDLKLT